MKRSIKTLLGEVMFTSRLDSILLADVAVVVAFHRIDEAPDSDSLTVGREMFERYCRFFKRHFHVVPLRDLVYRLEHGDSIERHLAITFDDGNRDNFEHAAPVLAALSLPATFFIVSKWMGSHVVPWWDRVGPVARRKSKFHRATNSNLVQEFSRNSDHSRAEINQQGIA